MVVGFYRGADEEEREDPAAAASLHSLSQGTLAKEWGNPTGAKATYT
jgi:hypothetical protein